jgi:hypothetical protein
MIQLYFLFLCAKSTATTTNYRVTIMEEIKTSREGNLDVKERYIFF